MCTLLTAAASLTHHLASDAHTHTQLLSDSCLAKVIDFIILGFISVITGAMKLCIFVKCLNRTKESTLWRDMKRSGPFG